MWFGLPVILGHGVLIRRSALQAAGGFPEETSEDIVLSGRLTVSGWKGVIAWTNGMAAEEVPADFGRYARRLFRWTAQDARTLALRSREVVSLSTLPLAERLDWVVRNLKFPLAGIALPYLVAIAFVRGLMVPGPSQIGGWQVACALGACFCPFVAFALYHRFHISKCLSAFLSATTIAIMVIPVCFDALFSALRGPAAWPVATGDRLADKSGCFRLSAVSLSVSAALVFGGMARGEPLLALVGLCAIVSGLEARFTFRLVRLIVALLIPVAVFLPMWGVGTWEFTILICAVFALLLI